MKSLPTYRATPKDPLLWTLRLGGAVVTATSAFLLIKNVSHGIGDDLFCLFCLALGIVTVVASWLPER